MLVINKDNCNFLFEKYRACILKSIYDKNEDLVLGIIDSFVVYDWEIIEMDRCKAHWDEFNRVLFFVVECNNAGIEFEKNGQIEEAVKVYEKCISESHYPASHSYYRLMVIYRREKRYEDEMRIINVAIMVYGKDDGKVNEKFYNFLILRKESLVKKILKQKNNLS